MWSAEVGAGGVRRADLKKGEALTTTYPVRATVRIASETTSSRQKRSQPAMRSEKESSRKKNWEVNHMTDASRASLRPSQCSTSMASGKARSTATEGHDPITLTI